MTQFVEGRCIEMRGALKVLEPRQANAAIAGPVVRFAGTFPERRSGCPVALDGNEERSAVDVAAVSQAEAAVGATSRNRKEKQQDINNEGGRKKQEAQLVAVNDKKDDGAELASADVIACARCNREISKNDKFSIHCGASVASENQASTTRLCSSCQGEIGISDKFCRRCGASSLAVATPNGNSASPDCARGVDHNGRVDEVVASTRTSVKKKRNQKRAREPIATGGHSDTVRRSSDAAT